MNDANTEQSIFQAILEEGTRKFGKSDPQDRKVHGKLHGKDDFLAFARYVDPDFMSPGHILKLARKLEAVERGEIKRLMINMPPRLGKSYTTSQMFPAWYLGRNAKREIIQTSYSTEKAAEFTGFVRDLCEAPFYADIFPDLKVKANSRSVKNWRTTAGGKVIGAGVRGPITGRGAHLALIDDPVKDYDEAKSEIIRENVWRWFRSVLRTRLYPDAAIIVIMTRWVSDDLGGRLLERQGLLNEGGMWDLLKLPMVDEKGDLLWPEYYTQEEVDDIRESVGDEFWYALYQQEPIDEVDRLFTDPHMAEPPDNLKKYGFLDPAFGGGDYSALSVGGTDRGSSERPNIYITNGHIWKGQIHKTYNLVEKYFHRYNLNCLFIESNQAQAVLEYELKKRGLRVRSLPSIQNKHLRIVNYVRVNWDRLFFSRAVDSDYLKQIVTYSELANNDDGPDSLAGLIKQLGGGASTIDKRYNGFFNRLRR